MKRITLMIVPVIVAFGTMACDDDPGTGWIPDTSIDMGVDTTADTVPDPTADTIPDPTADTLPDTALDTSTDTATDTSGGAYGTLNASFNSTYIFDYDLVVADADGSYLSAHMGGLSLTGAFSGTFGSSGGAVPTPGAAQTLALAAHVPAAGTTPAFVLIMQQSQSTTAVLNPLVQMYFPNDTIAPGAFNLDIQTATDVMLLLLNSTGPSSACVLAVAIGGTLTVSTASGTTGEGGSIGFSGSAIPIYHPTATPLGDVSSSFTSSGMTICPIE